MYGCLKREQSTDFHHFTVFCIIFVEKTVELDYPIMHSLLESMSFQILSKCGYALDWTTALYHFCVYNSKCTLDPWKKLSVVYKFQPDSDGFINIVCIHTLALEHLCEFFFPLLVILTVVSVTFDDKSWCDAVFLPN